MANAKSWFIVKYKWNDVCACEHNFQQGYLGIGGDLWPQGMRIIISPHTAPHIAPISPHGGYSLIETKFLAAVVLMQQKNILIITAYLKHVML